MKKIGMAAFLACFALAAGLTGRMDMEAAGPGYDCIEQADDPKVRELAERIAQEYPVCPELVQAIAFYESSNRRTAISRWGDVGYMQVNPRWQKERMDKLGVTDLTDGYGNILVATDYLMELCGKYGDISLALMAYNMGEGAVQGDSGMNGYARRILELSWELERLHGK